MASVFLKLFNMSLTASWLVLAVIIFKLVFRKAPKFIHCALWLLVAFRLVIPISFESVFSLVPSSEVIPQDFISSDHFDIHTGFEATNSVINGYLDDHYYEGVTVSNGFGRGLTEIFAAVWITGLAALLIYAAVSYIRLRLKTGEAVKLDGNAYLCDGIPTPFILGVIKPRIFIPSSVDESDIGYILAHEMAHLKRLDYLWKPLGYLILCVYWFNPVMWLAYILLCRDIEFACDERVLRSEGEDIKKAYSTALLNCSMPGRLVSACPIAFGETGVRQRISAVLNYRKPAFWVVITAIVASMVIAVCFLTNPKTEPQTYNEDIFTDAYLTVDEVMAQNGAMSMILTAENMPHYYIKDNVLYTTYTEKPEDYYKSSWNEIGVLEDFTPLENSLDERTDFFDYDISGIIEDNLTAKRAVNGRQYCYVLYQKNGDIILCTMYETIASGVPDSLILHSLCRMNIVKDYGISKSGFSDSVWTATADSEISVTVKELNIDSDKPYLTVLWVNNSERTFEYTPAFSVYYINSDGEMTDCYTGKMTRGFDLNSFFVKAGQTGEYRVDLKSFDLSRQGWYRVYLSQRKADDRRWYVDFKIADGEFDTSPAGGQRYVCWDSADYINPYFELFENGNTFRFVFSEFYGSAITGTYSYSSPKREVLTLTDGKTGDRYVFNRLEGYDNIYQFDKKNSASLPEYQYSAYGVRETPIADGADFVLNEN